MMEGIGLVRGRVGGSGALESLREELAKEPKSGFIRKRTR